MRAAARDASASSVGRGTMLHWIAAAMLGVLAGAVQGQEAAREKDEQAASGLIAEARAYEHGEGVPRDQRRAASLYCQAARAGDVEATFSLGWMYANGRGVDRDDGVAGALFARAAAQGHEQARQMLRFVDGEGGEMPLCMRPPAPLPGEPVDTALDDSPDPFAELSPPKKKVADIVKQSAPGFGIDPRLALAIVAVESDFEPNARSVKDARGVMQLIDGTAARFNVRNRMDVAQNVRGGLSYLRWLLAYYEGRVRLAVAAYNAGEAAVDKYGGVPPYRETRDYVRRVLQLFPKEKHPYDPDVVGPSAAFARPAEAR